MGRRLGKAKAIDAGVDRRGNRNPYQGDNGAPAGLAYGPCAPPLAIIGAATQGGEAGPSVVAVRTNSKSVSVRCPGNL